MGGSFFFACLQWRCSGGNANIRHFLFRYRGLMVEIRATKYLGLRQTFAYWLEEFLAAKYMIGKFLIG